MKLTKFKQQLITKSAPELIAERDQTIAKIIELKTELFKKRKKTSSQLIELKKKLAIIHTQQSIKK